MGQSCCYCCLDGAEEEELCDEIEMDMSNRNESRKNPMITSTTGGSTEDLDRMHSFDEES